MFLQMIILTLSKVGASSSAMVTQTSSLGMWLPVYAEEWQGDKPLIDGDGTQYGAKGVVSGHLQFSQDKLPMIPEKYEVSPWTINLERVLITASYAIITTASIML